MTEEDFIQRVKNHAETVSLFKCIKLNENVDSINLDTLYLDCDFEKEINSIYDTSYYIKKKLKGLNETHPTNLNGVHIYSQNNLYIGTYLPEFKSLILQSSCFDLCIDQIIEMIKACHKQELELTKHKITDIKTINLAINGKIYNTKINKIANTTLWHFKELLSFSVGETPKLIYDENILTLDLTNHTSLLDKTIDELSTRAMKTIDGVKRNYDEKLEDIKIGFQRQLTKSIPIPNINFGDIVKHRLMISKYNFGVKYSFIVDIVVNYALNGHTGDILKLKKPYKYEDSILSFYIDLRNKLEKVTLTDIDNKPSEHMHVSKGSSEICTGSFHIIGKYYKPKELFVLKNRMVKLLSRINVDSHHYRQDIYDKLHDKVLENGSEEYLFR